MISNLIKIRLEAPSIEMNGQAILNCFGINKLFYRVIVTSCRNTVEEIVVRVNVIFKITTVELGNVKRFKVEDLILFIYIL